MKLKVASFLFAILCLLSSLVARVAYAESLVPLKDSEPFKAASIMTAVFLVLAAGIAYFVKYYYGTSHGTHNEMVLETISKTHVGNQVYASLLRVRDKEFLVVVGNKNAPGISVVETKTHPISKDSIKETASQEASLIEKLEMSVENASSNQSDLGHAA